MSNKFTLTKQAIRSIKSLYRDNDEREMYRHEYKSLAEMVDRGLIDIDDDNGVSLTDTGKKRAVSLLRADYMRKEGDA